MNQSKLFNLKNFLTVGFLALLLGIGAFSFSLWQTPKYKSTVRLIIVFNQDNIDTYTASKSANYIADRLGEVIYSDSFIDSVYKNDPALNDYLGYGSEKRQQAWKKIVKASVLENKGIIVVDSFGSDKYQTGLLSTSIANTLITQHGLYDGSQGKATINAIDNPSIYENWATTKILRDTALGFCAGLLIGLTFIIIFPNHLLFEVRSKKKKMPAYPSYNPASINTAIATEPVAYNEAPARVVAPKKEAEINSEFKTDNPWLEKYYEENLPEKLNR
jgi:capsular polysaccharide biosynthesis protein